MFRRRITSKLTRTLTIAAGLVLVALVPMAVAAGSGSIAGQALRMGIDAESGAAPVTTIHSTPTANAGGWNNSNVSVSFEATDEPTGSGVSTITYTIDGGSAVITTGSSVPTFTISTEASHAIAYNSVDASGNAEATQTASVRLDKTGPTTTDNHETTYTAPATITLTATDTLSGVAATHYTLDGNAGTGSSVTTSALGEHTLAYRSIDNADNLETATTTVTFSIGIAPTTSIHTTPTANGLGWNDDDVDVSFTTTDNGGSAVTTVTYTYDGSTHNTAGSSVSTFAISTEGSQAVLYHSTNTSGYAEESKTAVVRIDKSAPSTTDNHVANYATSASITLSPTDAYSGVASTDYTLDGHAGTGTTVTTSTVGSHTLAYASTDNVGHKEATKTVTFTVRTPHATSATLTGRSSVRYKRRYTLSGMITPSSAPGRVTITLKWYKGGRWRTQATKLVSKSSTGRFSYTFRPWHRGRWKATVQYAEHMSATEIWRASSQTKTFRVR